MAVKDKQQKRLIRKVRIRKHLAGTAARPRLAVFRSAKYIYAQVIDDASGTTLAACSSLEKEVRAQLKSTRSIEASKAIGKIVAERAKAKKVSAVVFDRSGYGFHGRVKALADSAREAGLNF